MASGSWLWCSLGTVAHCCSLTNILELSLPSFNVREEASIFLRPFFMVYFVLTHAELSIHACRCGSHDEQVYLVLPVPPFLLFAWGGVDRRLLPPPLPPPTHTPLCFCLLKGSSYLSIPSLWSLLY